MAQPRERKPAVSYEGAKRTSCRRLHGKKREPVGRSSAAGGAGRPLGVAPSTLRERSSRPRNGAPGTLLWVRVNSSALILHCTLRCRRRLVRRWARARGRREPRLYPALVEAVDVDWSMPSVSDRTCAPRSRGSFSVLSTSLRDRLRRSTRYTTTVSPSSAYSRSFFIPAHSIAVLLPEVTSAATSRFWTPVTTSAASCKCVS